MKRISALSFNTFRESGERERGGEDCLREAILFCHISMGKEEKGGKSSVSDC